MYALSGVLSLYIHEQIISGTRQVSNVMHVITESNEAKVQTCNTIFTARTSAASLSRPLTSIFNVFALAPIKKITSEILLFTCLPTFSFTYEFFFQGFFRRSIQQKIQYRPCTKNQQCNILRINRNRCQYCRLKKCISAGMSRDGE